MTHQQTPSPFQVLISNIQAELKNSTRDANGDWVFTQNLHTFFKSDLYTSQDSNNKVYLLAQLHKDYRAALCKARLAPWWTLTSLAVAQGNLGEVKDTIETAEKHGYTLNYSSLLTWSLYPTDLGKHPSNPSPEVAKFLLEQGANPNLQEGEFIKRALNDQISIKILGHLIDFGADGRYILQGMSDLKKSAPAYVSSLERELCSHTLRIKASPDTLEDVRYAADHTSGASRIKTIFNFKSRRVTELYENDQNAPQILSFPFEHYNREYLQDAHAHLVKLGGTPPDLPEESRKGVPMLPKMQIVKKAPT